MPRLNAKGHLGMFTSEQKTQISKRPTDAMARRGL